jgi:hypothetical protein
MDIEFFIVIKQEAKVIMIKSKRHPIKFYLTTGLTFLFINALGALMIFVFVDAFRKGHPQNGDYAILLVGLAFIMLAFYTVWRYFKNTPLISIDASTITFGYENYQLADIDKIKLTGKVPFMFIIPFMMEGIELKFNKGTVKYIYDDMYANTWQMKSLLDRMIIQKKGFKLPEDKRTNPDKGSLFNIQYFKGNLWTSMRGISLYGVIGFLLFITFQTRDNQSFGFVAFAIVFCLFWLGLHAWMMHYIGLNEKCLIVKNHISIWWQRVYPLDDIKEIVFESEGRRPNCMRVITKDYRHRVYPAATLRDKTWLDFKKHLEKRGIKVRNECI